MIGPLVIAGISVNEEDLPKLAKLGVKDSKLLTPHRREVLAVEIRRMVEKYAIEKLEPREIDQIVFSGKKLHKLNWLEAQTMAKVIEKLKPDKVYVDASDVVEERFKQDILNCLAFKVLIVSEHKADRTYPVVSAASIIAKVERDRETAKLASVYGDFGSGYPSDPRTIAFLKSYAERMMEYPDFVRKSWKTVRKTNSGSDVRQAKLM